MRWTQMLIPTTRETPANANSVSHQLLVRAGFVRQVSPDRYALLPLGQRVVHNLQKAVRREMAAHGAIEITLPASSTSQSVNHANQLVISCITSYRQLPLGLYHVASQNPDPEASGLAGALDPHVIETFHYRADGVATSHSSSLEVIEKILKLCALPLVRAADTGGSAVLYPCQSGPDMFLASDKGNYTATVRACAVPRSGYELGGLPHGELEKIHTPGMHTIDEVARYLEVRPDSILKTIVYEAGSDDPGAAYAPKWVVAVVRGDHQVNDAKLLAAARQFNATWIRLTDNEELRSRFAIGFVGPNAAMRQFFAVLIIDHDAAQDRAWVAGANEIDYHVKNFNWFRDAGDRIADPIKTAVADIRDAVPGDPSPLGDGGVLRELRGHKIASIQDRLATGARYVDESGSRREIVGSYSRIDLTRLLIACVEQHHDENGIIWPIGIAPVQVCITPIRYEGQTREVADRLYAQLIAAGVDAILDDRDARPGYKFADADLVGIPVRINIGDRGLKEGKVELKLRHEQTPQLVPLGDIQRRVSDLLTSDPESD